MSIEGAPRFEAYLSMLPNWVTAIVTWEVIPQPVVFGRAPRRSHQNGILLRANEYYDLGHNKMLIVIHTLHGAIEFGLIDAQNMPELVKHHWHVKKPGNVSYMASTVHRCSVFAHRLVHPVLDGHFVDHIDGNGMHNCDANLRAATASINQFNRRGPDRGCLSGVRGLVFIKKYPSRPWRATVDENGVRQLKYCATKSEAIEWLDKTRREVEARHREQSAVLEINFRKRSFEE